MNYVSSMVDLSNKSICISLVIFIIVVFVSKKILDTYDELGEEDERGWSNIIYSIMIGFVSFILSLAAYKQLIRDDCDILTDPFCSKINIA
jgi:L-cystine uptake protein TcyP (sodium:dicarboxylate symporter family)